MNALEKILIVQTAFIGDAILTLPMIQKLKVLYPESTIDVIANPLTSQIFSASPFVNQVIVLDKRGEHKSLFSIKKFAEKIRERNYSKLFSPHRSLRTSLIVLLSEIKETYGFDNSSIMHVYKHLIPYNYNVHEVQRNLDLINFKYDENSWRIMPEVSTDAGSKEKIKRYLNEKNIKDNLIIIAPGSIWNTKQYPSEYYSNILSYFVNKSFKVILIGGEKDKQICDALASVFQDSVYSSAGEFSIVESIELLRFAKILLCNDSAPTHMGMCANIPVLTLYCSTSFKFGFYPYNLKSSYLSYDDLFCKPCGIHGYDECPLGTFDCGYMMKPDIVISKIERMLNDKI